MFFGIITLLTALLMASVAAVFAIYGIIAIFAGMPAFALVMGAVIELGKVVGISWIYRNWREPTKIKYMMMPLVLVAMMLTSMGIFGLLSKAHLEQSAPVANNEIKIERIDQQIAREKAKIADNEKVIAQLDTTVQSLLDANRIRGTNGALSVRQDQAPQREVLRQTIDTAQAQIDTLEGQRLELNQQLKSVELEVGPVKYIAELVYGEGTNRIEEAVRWVIIAFIFVFDPMAVLLLMAANYTLANIKRKAPALPDKQETPQEPIQEPDKSFPVSSPDKEPDPVVQSLTPASVSVPYNPPSYETTPIDDSQSEVLPVSEPAVSESIPDSSKKKLQQKEIVTEGVTPLQDMGGGYVEYNNKLFQANALKEIKPDLFILKVDDQAPNNGVGFGTQFPKMATKGKIFVRVDTLPHKVFKFDGKKWIEINKNLTSSYLENDYVRYLANKIETGEYDVDILTDQEKNQITEYLQS